MNWATRLVAIALGALSTWPTYAQSGATGREDPLLGAASPTTDRSDPLLDPTVLIEKQPTPCDNWRLSADVGLPIGLRLQHRLFESNWWGEVGIGAWWIVPYASTCLRYDCTLLKRERNLFAIRPGVSATCIPVGPTLGVGIDSEFIWQHTFGGRLTTELGARLGVTTVIPSGRDRWLSNAFPVPVVCLMWSWQF